MDHSRRLAVSSIGLAAMAAFGARRLQAASTNENSACAVLLDHHVRPLMQPEPVSLCERYSGQVLLLVNTASKCGFTSQFEQLEALHQKYSPAGFSVLGFPSDDFRQELADEAAVAEFCELNYGVSFPMFQKLSVSGPGAHPLYRSLANAGGDFPRWNFFKFLLDRQGKLVARYDSMTNPMGDTLVSAVETALDAPRS